MRVSAIDDTGEVRAVERADHPFFIGTLYQPQRTSSPDAPHPLWVAFVGAVAASGATTFVARITGHLWRVIRASLP